MDWCRVGKSIYLNKTLTLKRREDCSECGLLLGKHQFLCLDSTAGKICPEAFCPRCALKNMYHFQKYHSDHFIREMIHGHHALVEITEHSEFDELGDVILNGYKTSVPEVYWEADTLESELQTSSLVDYCDFCNKPIERIQWKCLGCRSIDLCDACHEKGEPEDKTLRNEFKRSYCFLRIFDF